MTWNQPEAETAAGTETEAEAHPHALTREEQGEFSRLLAITGMNHLAVLIDADEPSVRVALMRCWKDGEPRAALVITFQDEQDPDEIHMTPVALLLTEDELEHLSDVPPGD